MALKIKKVLPVLLNIFWLPSIIIHELSHLVLALILFTPIKEYTLKFNLKNPIIILIEFKKKKYANKPVQMIIAAGPLIQMTIFFVLAIDHPFFMYLSIYQILTIHHSFMSNNDISCFIYQILPHIRISYPNYYKTFYLWLFSDYYNKKHIELFESENPNREIN